jgi:hypothetical protein
VVDVDLSKFFDRVNREILIDRLRKRIDDAGVIAVPSSPKVVNSGGFNAKPLNIKGRERPAKPFRWQ